MRKMIGNIVLLGLGAFTVGVGIRIAVYAFLGDFPMIDLLDTVILVPTGSYVGAKAIVEMLKQRR